MQTSLSKLSEREIAEAWANITIQLWRKNLSRMKIGQNSSGDLNRSFKYKVIAGSRGNVDRIEFAFRYYGKFHLDSHPIQTASVLRFEIQVSVFVCEVG